MRIFIKLEVEDIVTVPFKDNIAIEPPDGMVDIILSKEAARELIGDLEYMLGIVEEINKELYGEEE